MLSIGIPRTEVTTAKGEKVIRNKMQGHVPRTSGSFYTYNHALYPPAIRCIETLLPHLQPRGVFANDTMNDWRRPTYCKKRQQKSKKSPRKIQRPTRKLSSWAVVGPRSTSSCRGTTMSIMAVMLPSPWYLKSTRKWHGRYRVRCHRREPHSRTTEKPAF